MELEIFLKKKKIKNKKNQTHLKPPIKGNRKRLQQNSGSFSH